MSLIYTSSESTAKIISCGPLQVINFSHSTCSKTCSLWGVEISSADVTISGHASTNGLTFGRNKNILFLPIELASSFPNLIAYTASNNFVSSIGKQHFENLRMLKELRLNENQIEVVARDTFEDLISLQWLNLGERKFLM